VGVNNKGVNIKLFSHSKKKNYMEINQPKNVKPKTGERKVRCVNWYGALEEKGLKQMGVKQGLCVPVE